jgi:hypothetical protein
MRGAGSSTGVDPSLPHGPYIDLLCFRENGTCSICTSLVVLQSVLGLYASFEPTRPLVGNSTTTLSNSSRIGALMTG